MKKLGRKSESESAKCKRLSEKSHKYSHCRQEKCFSLYLHQDGYNDKDDDVLSLRSYCDIFAKFDLLEIIDDGLVVSEEYQCDGDGDDVDGKICWFLAYNIHKSCCL